MKLRRLQKALCREYPTDVFMYVPRVCTVPVCIFRSPSARGALITSAPLPRVPALPLFFFFSFVLPAPVVLFFSNSPLFPVFSSPSSSDTSSSCAISALCACARTVCACVRGSCLLGLLAFSPHGSVECELPTSCYVRDTLLGVALPRAVLHTSTIDDTKVFLKIGANSSGGQSRFDDSRARRLFSASFALTRSSRRVSVHGRKYHSFPRRREEKKGRSDNLGLKPFVHT